MFEESKHEKQAYQDDHIHDDENKDLFSTACTTPNLTSIDEANSFITAALSLLPSNRDPCPMSDSQHWQKFSDNLHFSLTQASTILSHLKLQLTAELKLFETRLRSQHEQGMLDLLQEKRRLKSLEDDMQNEIQSLL